jgi:hypothetical protein
LGHCNIRLKNEIETNFFLLGSEAGKSIKSQSEVEAEY